MTFYQYVKKQQIKNRLPKAVKVDIWERQKIKDANKGVIL